MKTSTRLTVGLLVLLISAPLLAMAETNGTGVAGLDEAMAKAYLEKTVEKDTGSCLVQNKNVDILGISDVIPGHQTQVFYKFEYTLRCNRGSEKKNGQGVLHAIKLRDGNWIDQDNFTVITK